MAQSESEALLARLVAFDTTSRLTNLPLVQFVREYLLSHGIASQLVPGDGEKANLLATIGPADWPGFLLSGHTDVVPADAHQWKSDPFRMDTRDGRLFGRGCADMKGFLASVLAAAPRLASSPLRVPVHVAFTYDEEVGCLGVHELLHVIDALPVRPAMGIVGEPTSLRIMVGHKGKRAYRLRVRGRECHSGTPAAGVNAVQYAARIVTFIAALNEEKRTYGPFDDGYDVPHSTLHVGSIHGGASLNVVPAECVVEFEIRHLSLDAPEVLIERIANFINRDVVPSMRMLDAGLGVDWEETITYPGLSTPADAEVVAFVTSLLDAPEPPSCVAFGTEAGLFHERCHLPMVVCGPGAMADAHRADESLAQSQLAACDTMLDRLGAALCC